MAGWLSRLREGLSKSTKKVAESITGLFTKKKLDQQTLDDLEDVLIQADLGVTVAARLVAKLGKERFGKEVTDEEVRAAFDHVLAGQHRGAARDDPHGIAGRMTIDAEKRMICQDLELRKPVRSAGRCSATGRLPAAGPRSVLRPVRQSRPIG